MRKGSTSFSVLILAACCFSAAAWGATIFPIGYYAWDVTAPGSTGEFDIVNLTGPNSSVFPDTTFPVTTSVNLSSLSLLVDFSNSTSQIYGSSYFTLDSDGLSFDGSSIAIGGTNPLPAAALLTGTFSPLSVDLNSGGGAVSINSAFSAAILPDPGNTTLADGDLAVINATTSTGPPPVPEPGTWMLTAIGLGCLAFRKLYKFCN